MKEQVIITTIDSRGVARLTMNRPQLKNAFNEELIGGICDAMGRLNADQNVRAIVLTGAGDAFSAGGDLNMMRRAGEASAAENKDDARRLAHMLHSIYSSPKPTIALVNGPAMGGGVGLVAACDIAIASEDAFFALSEVRLGLIPAVISPFVVEAIGARQARRYFLTGERFDAETARRIGLVHMVAMTAQLEATFDGALKSLLACGPNAQHEAKELIRAVAGHAITDAVMEDTAGRIARMRASAEGKEGMTAFLEKRKPNWVKGE
ncbi:MAG TPA: enoyl-CoA hydratase/isomerase family protein, partial [Parvularculaceae bacterium]|nr:enoyl-CoA hydratase/isomerase family protein [Caulobacterales bacterium]HPE32622.1 enoyl-CoA hydratase/isomerase family protein [Parvularculaceae bacterium]